MLIKDPLTGKTIIQPARENVRYIDTGKVKIGCAYIPPPRRLTDSETQLQNWILERKPIFRRWW